MRCFLACFGLSKTRKHRKPLKGDPYARQIHGRYESLESDVKLDLISNISESESSASKEKAISSISLKKKVSFNLNIKSYEPLPHVEYANYSSDSEEDTSERKKEDTLITSFDDLEIETFPSNYRYQNWRESDDDMALEESDLDSYGNDDNDEENSEELIDDLDEGEKSNAMTLVASLNQELNKLGFDSKAKRDRSEYVFSVLNPIENLAQWKAAKAKRAMPSKQQLKENTKLEFDCKANTREIKAIMQDTTVNTSLSNWLAPSK